MKYSLLLGTMFLTTTAALAQNMLGISTSRYGGTNRLYINPALAADSPSEIYFNIGTVNGHLDNNYVRYQAPFSLFQLITGSVPPQYRKPNGALDFSTNYTRENLDGAPKNGTLSGEVRGPAILKRVGESSAFAITTRFRAIAQVTNASQELLSAIRSSLNDGAIYGIPNRNNGFGVNANTYSEIGVTYAGALFEGEASKLLLGATAKVLLGYNAQHLINRGLDYQVVADPDNPNSALLEVNRFNATLGYTTYLQNRGLGLGTLLNPSAPGKGVGLDVGLTFVSQYDSDSPAWRLGAAVTDIGGLTYKGEQYEYVNRVQTNPIIFRSSDFDRINSASDLLNVIQTKFNANRTPDDTRFWAGLPTSLNLTADYQLPDGAGISVTYLRDMRSDEATSVHQPTLFAITPRYDKRWLSFALPISYLNRGLTAGASLRVGPAWLGTDNFLGLVGTSSNGIRPRGLDVYGGVAFGLGGSRRDDY
ncbi:DUF5723 family protein [Spirosoma sp. KUDC1026]|uniref:DUF5723 family protein n=1 Tax=Spirosoma sp. KUDC1026 TaxID=2745947 RepID=UPI00159BEAC4|nr:DUF5723 family protein [Spirosoma sp. KUDC1026]QKZ14241.1 hypothetical protein HU175_17045 [Spirosoma sp. KUDC1026]